MSGIAQRIEGRAGEASPEVVRRLEAGEALAVVAGSLEMDALDLIAAVARDGLGDEGAEGLSLIQSRPSHPSLAKVLSETALVGLFPGASRPSRLALSAGLLQILDFWDASHTAAQEADDLGERITSTSWHMIAHRREPDPGNALYWARRVGRHPVSGSLAEAARPLLESFGDRALSDRLLPGGTWSSPAMIDLCTRARPGSPETTLARRLQRLEMLHLLDATVAECLPPDR